METNFSQGAEQNKTSESRAEETRRKKEIEKIVKRLDRLDRGGKPTQEGEYEALQKELKDLGGEYVNKRAKQAKENIDKSVSADDSNEKQIAEKGKKDVDQVEKAFSEEMGVPVPSSESADKVADSEKASSSETPAPVSEDVNKVVDKEKGSASVEAKVEAEEEKKISEALKTELKSLGITEEKLKAEEFKKFRELSSGSQLLVLKNLKGIILEDITKKSRDENKVSGVKMGWFFGKIRKSLKENRLTNKSREEKLKELSIRKISPEHVEKIDKLSSAVSLLEIDVFEKNGNIEVSLFKEKEDMSPEQKKAIAELNLKANEFLNIPKEMSYASAKKEDQEKYEKAFNKYLESRGKLVKELGDSPDTIDKINRADFQLKMVRDFKNDFVLSEEWEEAVKNPGFFNKIRRSMTTKESAVFMASGYALRTAAGAMSLSMAALPIAMGIGALRSGRKAAKELGKRDAKDIYKEKGKSPLAIQRTKISREMGGLVPDEFRFKIDEWMEREGEWSEAVKKYKKLEEELSEIDKKLSKEQSTKLNIVDANSLITKLDRLVDDISIKISAELKKEKPDYKKIQNLKDSLRLRISFTREKRDDELINFGSYEARTLNHFTLQRSLDQAEAYLASDNLERALELASESLGEVSEDNKESDEKIKNKFDEGQKRLEKFLDRYTEGLSRERRKYIINKAIKGAMRSGIFVGAGMAFREIYEATGGVSEDVVDQLTDTEHSINTEEVNEVVAKGVVRMVNNESLESDSFSNVADSTFVKTNIDSMTDSTEFSEGVGRQVAEQVDSGVNFEGLGIKTEGMSSGALESLKEVGNINRAITLEKGQGISKIFDGRMGGEHTVRFVDSEGKMIEAAASSKIVHPGDQVILGEDGEVYVFCKSGITDNPDYGLPVENTDNIVENTNIDTPKRQGEVSGQDMERSWSSEGGSKENTNSDQGESISGIKGSDFYEKNRKLNWNMSGGIVLSNDGKVALMGWPKDMMLSDVASIKPDGQGAYLIEMFNGDSYIFEGQPLEEGVGPDSLRIYDFVRHEPYFSVEDSGFQSMAEAPLSGESPFPAEKARIVRDFVERGSLEMDPPETTITPEIGDQVEVVGEEVGVFEDVVEPEDTGGFDESDNIIESKGSSPDNKNIKRDLEVEDIKKNKSVAEKMEEIVVENTTEYANEDLVEANTIFDKGNRETLSKTLGDFSKNIEEIKPIKSAIDQKKYELLLNSGKSISIIVEKDYIEIESMGKGIRESLSGEIKIGIEDGKVPGEELRKAIIECSAK